MLRVDCTKSVHLIAHSFWSLPTEVMGFIFSEKGMTANDILADKT